MEVTVQTAAFYSPGGLPNPSQASRDESQGKPGPGPGGTGRISQTQPTWAPFIETEGTEL